MERKVAVFIVGVCMVFSCCANNTTFSQEAIAHALMKKPLHQCAERRLLYKADGSPDIMADMDIPFIVVDSVTVKLDVFYPITGAVLPGLIMVHGGAWWMPNCDKSQYHERAKVAARRGYVAVCVDYRLSNMKVNGRDVAFHFPAHLEDVKTSIRWLKHNAAYYGVDTNRIGLIGSSAGGHLGLLATLTEGYEGEGYKEHSSALKAVVSLYPPSDLTTDPVSSKDASNSVVRLMGGTLAEKPEEYRKASPIFYVRENTIPMLTIHGDADPVVPVGQSIRFADALKKAGAMNHNLVIIKDFGHGDPEERLMSEVKDIYFNFFDKFLK